MNPRRQIALLPSQAKLEVEHADKLPGILREEQSRDHTDEKEIGIMRHRFFSKGDQYPGLYEVLSEALGQKVMVPEPKPFWNEV